MTARSTLPGAGRTTPAASRYPQLDNRDWWSLHGSKSDTTLARMVGCHRDTVRAARHRNGVPPLAKGRARGAPIILAPPSRDPLETVLIARIHSERRRRIPPSEDLLVARIKSAHQARSAGDPNAYDDALLGISAAAALIYDHRQQLRRAA